MALASPPRALLQSKAQVVRFWFSDIWLPSPRFIVPIADAFRSATLEAHSRLAGARTSFVLSGRCADGSPDKDHAHAFYLPEVDDDDRIVGIRVVSPQSAFADE
jgi:hypothetical protein